MAKCTACGSFISRTEGAKCSKCAKMLHKACVSLPETAAIPATWMCPDCKNKVPKGDNSSTPVKGICSELDLPTLAPRQGNSEFSAPDLLSELRLFREELKDVREEIKGCKTEIAKFHSSLQLCCNRVESLEIRVGQLEKKNEEKSVCDLETLESTIADLKLQLNDRDQDLLLNDIEISGIQEEKLENTSHLVKTVAMKIGIDINENDIVSAERVGMVRRDRSDGENSAVVDGPRRVAVRFARRTLRDDFIRAARVRRGTNTEGLGLPGVIRRIYVNERLTSTNRRLFGKAREAARRLDWKYIWTKQGRIFVRKEQGKALERIRSESDITRIFG